MTKEETIAELAKTDYGDLPRPSILLKLEATDPELVKRAFRRAEEAQQERFKKASTPKHEKKSFLSRAFYGAAITVAFIYCLLRDKPLPDGELTKEDRHKPRSAFIPRHDTPSGFELDPAEMPNDIRRAIKSVLRECLAYEDLERVEKQSLEITPR